MRAELWELTFCGEGVDVRCVVDDGSAERRFDKRWFQIEAFSATSSRIGLIVLFEIIAPRLKRTNVIAPHLFSCQYILSCLTFC
jgi:hypothetical protein